jgi:probable HAF family extracellular repeat protein
VRKLVAICSLVIAAMSVSPIGSAASTAPSYAVRPIDPPRGFTHVYPTHVNAAGVIVGNALNEDNTVQHAFVWSAGTSTDLGTLGGAASSARDVNDAGVVVGEAGTGGADDEVHAVVWDGGFVADLGEPGQASGAYGVSSHGLIVGYEGDHLGSNHAMLWKNGVGQLLDRFTTGFSNAVSINDAEQILLTGVPTGAGGTPESFIWEGGPLTGVGPFAGTAINSSGDVVGYRASPSGDVQGVVWQVGLPRPLSGPAGERVLPLGINDSSQVVGWMGQTLDSERAFLWDDGELLDLNERIPADAGWFLSRATAINEQGQVVGFGVFQGQLAGFVLTPE